MAKSDWGGFEGDRQSHYGSSAMFDQFIREKRPDLKVPEGSITMREPGIGWSPANETPPAPGEVCRWCRGETKRGSKLYCAACTDSGYRAQLREQLRLAGIPPREDMFEGEFK